MGCSLLDSSFHGILQTRILEWVTFPSPGDLPNPGTEPRSPPLQADSLLSEPEVWLNIPLYIHDLEIYIANRSNEIVLYINHIKVSKTYGSVGKDHLPRRMFWKNLLQLTVHDC